MTPKELEKLLETIKKAARHSYISYFFGAELEVRTVIDEFKELKKENKRLRALIKKAEHAGDFCDDPACPWCLARSWGKHLDCPAFSPDGSVK